MLRDYQADICRRTVEALDNHRSVMVQMPTGTGKTVVLAELVHRHISAGSVKRGEWPAILVVAHRRELIEQIKDTIRRLGIDEGHIMVESIQTVSRRISSLSVSPSLVVIDEAHHALAKTYKMMWDAWHEAKFLGLTATPCRMNRAGFTDLFEVLITSHTIGGFIREGWLSLFDYYSIKADSEEQKIIDTLEKRGADGDYQPKELDAVLNRRPSIGRLYESVCRYAKGTKGIVYAISIDHAHNIADYYRAHGIEAVAIDSKTPAEVRKQTVEDFKTGKIRIMVSVDLFSEGFDCPDVGFIQLARPTLSLAKYLQMVGRGLRKSKGKESCVMIDNVGLYRLFGLPAVDRDWQAMFEGRMAGKGSKAKGHSTLYYAMTAYQETNVTTDAELEKVIDHGSLQTLLYKNAAAVEEDLRAFPDKGSGLYGLKRGDKVTAIPRYIEVFGTNATLAAVRFQDGNTGLVDEEGNIKKIYERHASLRLLDRDILMITGKNNKVRYVDLCNDMEYSCRPTPVRFGKVEMLRVGERYYDRTGHPYMKGFDRNKTSIKDKGFYIDIFFASYDSCWYDMLASLGKPGCLHTACILANDDAGWYILYQTLADGSIIVMDINKNYYYVEDGKEKRFIGNEQGEEAIRLLASGISKLRESAEKRKERMLAEKLKRRLTLLREVKPFSQNNKWGLRLDGRVIVPPIYRSIKEPVGDYCAVELSPQRWGIIQLDGKMIVDACYYDVGIMKNGTANLTVFPGKTIKVNLRK